MSIDSTFNHKIILGITRHAADFSRNFNADSAIPKWRHRVADRVGITPELSLEDAENLLLNFCTYGEVVELDHELKSFGRSAAKLDCRNPDSRINDDDQAVRLPRLAARD